MGGKWGEGGGANLYAYAGNDPVNSSDYLGLFAYQRYVGMRAFTVARMSLSVSSRSDAFRLGTAQRGQSNVS